MCSSDLSYSQVSPNNGEGGLFFFILPFLEQQDLYNATFSPIDRGILDPANNSTGGRNGGLPTYVGWNAQALNQNINSISARAILPSEKVGRRLLR